MSELNASNLRKEQGNEGPDLVGTTELTSPYFMVPPSGTTAERPENPEPGTLRFNTDSGSLEYFKGDTLGWESINREVSAPLGARGIFAGGNGPATRTAIDYITIATTGNAQDFGDSDVPVDVPAGAANLVRGIVAGGYAPAPTSNDTSNISNTITTYVTNNKSTRSSTCRLNPINIFPTT